MKPTRHSKLVGVQQQTEGIANMSDIELVDELTAQAKELEDADGAVNPFLVHEHEILMKAAERLIELSARPPTPR
jgi:hypothetical protein